MQTSLELTKIPLLPTETWVLVPVKTLSQAKSRLADFLSKPERVTLAANLVRHTLTVLQTLQQAAQVAGCVVVSADPEVLWLAQDLGMLGWSEQDLGMSATCPDQLNCVVQAATKKLLATTNLTRLLILPCDLPRLTVPDLQAMLTTGASQAVLTPDHLGQGTNALLLSRAVCQNFCFQFGPDSFRHHRQELAELGQRPTICDRPGLRFDLDYAADFARLSPQLKERLLTINGLID